MKEGPDPSDFFRGLKEANASEETWVGFWPSIRAGIREAELRRRPAMTPAGVLVLGSSAGIMAAAAILALAFLVAPVVRLNQPLPSGAAPVLPAGNPARGAGGSSLPILEDLGSSSARVYTFHVGEKADATDVILIVDESIDI